MQILEHFHEQKVQLDRDDSNKFLGTLNMYILYFMYQKYTFTWISKQPKVKKFCSLKMSHFQ